MYKDYKNFVRASISLHEHFCGNTLNQGGHQDGKNLQVAEPGSYGSYILSGEEAKKIYLDEVDDVKNQQPIEFSNNYTESVSSPKIDKNQVSVSDKELFMIVQNNDVETLRFVLNCFPDMINTADEFGWSLLMIGCQANAIDTVKELLKRNIDTSTTDKAGNSAYSLIIKNKNIVLADILITHRKSKITETKKSVKEVEKKEEYLCDVCNKVIHNKNEHLSSTIHNINVSKGKKIRPSFKIPETNKGFQIMLKVGWDKESGLGKDGSGKRYPIKTEKKTDRKGLGHKKLKEDFQKAIDKHSYRKTSQSIAKNSRAMEINFRREFY